jgi:hypothetical protein
MDRIRLKIVVFAVLALLVPGAAYALLYWLVLVGGLNG